jgi:hypothetical protein
MKYFLIKTLKNIFYNKLTIENNKLNNNLTKQYYNG